MACRGLVRFTSDRSSSFLVRKACADTSAQQPLLRSCAGHCDSRRRRRSCEQHACAGPQGLHPLPADQNPLKKPHPWPVRESVSSRAQACTSPFFDPKIKLSFASALNSVSFYWPEQPWAEGPLLGDPIRRVGGRRNRSNEVTHETKFLESGY